MSAYAEGRTHDLGGGFELSEYIEEGIGLVGYFVTGPAAAACPSPWQGRCGGLAPVREYQGRPVWNVSGEWPLITLSPSVMCSCNGQHAFVQNGRWTGAQLDEPPARLLDLPAVSTDAAAPEPQPTYFCDQCGARYFGPGICSNAHEPTQLKNLAEAEAAETGQVAAAAEPAPPVEPPAVEQAPAEVPAPEVPIIETSVAEPPAAPPAPAPAETAEPPAEPAVAPAAADEPAALGGHVEHEVTSDVSPLDEAAQAAPVEAPAAEPAAVVAEPEPAAPAADPVVEAKSLLQRALDLLHSL